MIKVILCGACGKMGMEVVKTIDKNQDIKLIAAIDLINIGEDIGSIVLNKKTGIIISDDLFGEIKKTSPDIMVDFTTPKVVMDNIKIALKNKVNCVIGTTGITEENLTLIKDLCEQNNVSAIIAPNFAIGAVLMMKFSKEAGKYFNNVEIIELHHDKKLDAPSGTAIKTAEMIKSVIPHQSSVIKEEIEKIKNVRGGDFQGIRIHSVRLPGFVAHQEVIFGTTGQILTIRHDSISRESFMPGVIMAIRRAKEIKGLIYGLENLI